MEAEAPVYRILSASYVSSVHSPEQLAEFSLPEAAIVGRSNVGKSTLLNALCNVRKLAQTGRTPGRTQAINLFDIAFREDSETPQETMHAHLVDLPGYGYAKVARSKKKAWSKLLGDYVVSREELRVIVLLVDCRRDPEEEELWFSSCREDIPVCCVLTKADKLGRNDLQKRRNIIAKKLGCHPSDIFVTSAEGKDKRGLDELRSALCSVLSQ